MSIEPQCEFCDLVCKFRCKTEDQRNKCADWLKSYEYHRQKLEAMKPNA